MKFKFLFTDETEWKELKHIVKVEAEKAFPPAAIYRFHDNYAGNEGAAVFLDVENIAYFEDIEKAKERMYEMENRYMTDFISNVKENLSFVPRIIVE